MSGSTIGGVVGGVIGFMVGGPFGAQVGWVAGSMLGGIVDPQQIEGPRLTQFEGLAAQDGASIAYGDGTFVVPKPCVIWATEPAERRHKESSKGGPDQITYTYHRSYAILVCRGPISGYLIIKRAGKIVYDARTDAELTALGYTSDQISETRAAQAQFLQEATLYYGTEDQMPDPTMTAIKGAGNVPAYRGSAYIVMKDAEGASGRGEIDQYEFVVRTCGDRHEDYDFPSFLLVSGSSGVGVDYSFVASEAEEEVAFTGLAPSTGANLSAAIPDYANGIWAAASSSGVRYSTDNRETWQSASLSLSGQIKHFVGGPDGWLAVTDVGGNVAISGPTPNYFVPHTISAVVGTNLVNISQMLLVRHFDGLWWVSGSPTGLTGGILFTSPRLSADVWTNHTGTRPNGIIYFHDVVRFAGSMYASVTWHSTFRRSQLRRSHDGGKTWPHIVAEVAPGGNNIHQLEVGGGILVAYCRGASEVWTSADGFAEPHPTGIQTVASDTPANATIGRQIRYQEGRFYIISGSFPGDPSKQNKCVTTEDGISFSAPVPLGTLAAKGIAAGGLPTGWEAVPDAPGYYIDRATGIIHGPPGTRVDPCTPTLGSIVADQCNRRGVSTIDVAELPDPVTGFCVANPSSPQKNIAALMPGYFFDSSEFDGTLHFPKRGRPDSFALTVDDLVDREGDLIQWERTQEIELLRKVDVGYVDPAMNYAATTQQWERRSGTIDAKGEGAIELAVVGTKDWAVRVAHKSVKIAWGENEKATLHVSIGRAELVTGAVGTVTDEEGEVHRIRIERIEDEGLVRMLEVKRTRADLYESSLSGAPKPLPSFPGSNLRGPTDSLLLNIPAAVETHDAIGLRWAAAGMLSGWAGAVLQIQRDGQWQDLATVTDRAGVGTLLAPLPAHSGDIDTANVLRVRFNEELSSITYPQLLGERNSMAILYPDGTAEIVQFQNAVEVAEREYELAYLLRGRLDTVRGDHATGARVVFLDGRVPFVPLQQTDLGRTLTLRAISLGTNPDAYEPFAFDFDTAHSSMEWPVAHLDVEADGDDYHITWRPRHRFGTDEHPVRSANWLGYRVSWTHSGGSGSQDVTTEAVTLTLPGATDVAISVAQINRLTGAGPATTVTAP